MLQNNFDINGEQKMDWLSNIVLLDRSMYYPFLSASWFYFNGLLRQHYKDLQFNVKVKYNAERPLVSYIVRLQ